MNSVNRRKAIQVMAGTAAVFSSGKLFANSPGSDELKEDLLANNSTKLKGNILHSVCKWCYPTVPLEDLCKSAKDLGLSSIDLVGPEDWPMLKKYDLTCAMPQGAGKGIMEGWNDLKLHDSLLASYEDVIPKAADSGLNKLICFSGNRNGKSDEEGLENCAIGLKRLMKTAEKYKVTVSMELLNSKVNHKDYQCDHSAWGIELVKRVGSDQFKLLYDIYHMQIMEGDIIATIKNFHPYFSHYHTGGVPGRNEIDQSQELNYPAIMKAIVETGYKGFVAQEFIPKHKDKIESLRQSVIICDV